MSSPRRALWFACALLGAGAVGVAAWFALGSPGPSPDAPTPDARVPAAPAPSDLEALGAPAYVIYMEPEASQGVAADSVVAWRFVDEKVLVFKPGMFIRRPGEPERFRLVDVRRPDADVHTYEIVYDVHDDPKTLPSKAGVVLRFVVKPPSRPG